MTLHSFIHSFIRSFIHSFIHNLCFTNYCVIVRTKRFSHDNCTMKPQYILLCTHVCQTNVSVRHPKVPRRHIEEQNNRMPQESTMK